MPDVNITPATTRVDGFIVVSRGINGSFAYQHHAKLEDARHAFERLRGGIGYKAHALVPAINGIPYDGELDWRAMDLVRPGVENSPENRHYWSRFKVDHPECHSGVIYRQGQQAHAMGVHQMDCPFIEGCPERAEWARGWHGQPSLYSREEQ